MPSSRRDLLRAGLGLAASAAAAGCGSLGGSNVSYPSTTAREGTTATTTDPTTAAPPDTTAEPTGTPEPTTREPTTTVPSANPDLAAATASVVEETVWLATEYGSAVEAYRSAVGRVRTIAGQLRNASSVDDARLRSLESAVERLATVVSTRLQPHFPGVDGRLADPENAFVADVRKFARRGDWDRTQTAVGELFDFYNGKAQDAYVEDAFSLAPVQGRLLTLLVAAESPGPALFEVGYPPARFGAFAYAGEDRHPTDEPMTAPDRNGLNARFDPVSVDAGRRDDAYVVPKVLPGGFDRRSTDDLRSTPVYVQRFRDERAAADAVVSVLDGPAVQEGSERLAGVDWRRVYYYHDGDVNYGYLVRAGRFLLTTGLSRTAWEERPANWSDPLERSWLWDG